MWTHDKETILCTFLLNCLLKAFEHINCTLFLLQKNHKTGNRLSRTCYKTLFSSPLSLVLSTSPPLDPLLPPEHHTLLWATTHMGKVNFKFRTWFTPAAVPITMLMFRPKYSVSSYHIHLWTQPSFQSGVRIALIKKKIVIPSAIISTWWHGMILQPEAERAAVRPLYKTKWVSMTTDVALMWDLPFKCEEGKKKCVVIEISWHSWSGLHGLYKTNAMPDISYTPVKFVALYKWHISAICCFSRQNLTFYFFSIKSLKDFLSHDCFLLSTYRQLLSIKMTKNHILW